ncbi:SdpI family protein [Heyndrickxia acidicola]|uniref:SdpI family protein n=1 Tax=Heyndrickxia acidicola TaxID=209389 RepID=A0ABU6MN46_9BACI|nr:SdpI family protein [Heyndrickxia acidicola]MED1205822.1 SdpI family protein [Heyndrickxia acidicola]
MKKKNNAMPWWGWLTWVLAIILGIIAYTHLPAEVAGKANHMRPSWLIVLYEPAIMLVIILLWHVLWRIDPKKKNYDSFWSTYRYIGGVIVVCIGIIYATVLGHSLHILSIRFAPSAYGIMFMLIANISTRLQPNWWVGFRTPWTLSSTESWIRTHRLGGQLGIPMGLLIIIFAWTLPLNLMMIIAVVVPVILWVGIIVVASYFYAKIEIPKD